MSKVGETTYEEFRSFIAKLQALEHEAFAIGMPWAGKALNHAKNESGYDFEQQLLKRGKRKGS